MMPTISQKRNQALFELEQLKRSDFDSLEKFEMEKKRILSRLIHECVPTIRQVQEMRLSKNRMLTRAKQAENKVDAVVELAEKALCDDLDKNELFRTLESIIKECGYDDTSMTNG